MWADPLLSGACLLVTLLVALPAVLAGRRRRVNRELSEVATQLIDFATSLRRADRSLPIDESLLSRARRLRVPELVCFEFAQSLAAADPMLLAESAQRLGLRLKRRVAFGRKMLARTAPGRWRGSIVAAAPVTVMLALAVAGVVLPATILVALLLLESLGCWLLWRAARVEV